MPTRTCKRPARADALTSAIRAMEQAIQLAPARGSRDKMIDSIDRAARAFQKHIVVSEGPGGLLADVACDCHHLTDRTERLRGEHVSLSRRFKLLQSTLAASRKATVTPRRLQDLLAALQSHHDCATDLFFEAYVRDMGARD